MKTTLNTGKIFGVFAVLWLGVIATPALLPHHSFAMYNQAIQKTLTGRIMRYVPGSNHAQMFFELLGPDGQPLLENGKPIRWGVEMASAAQLARSGVTGETFPAGTIVTVTLNPLRDGRNFGAMTNTAGGLIGCGKTMPRGGCTGETGKIYIGVGRP
jgi:hypothetical protein